MSFLDKFKNTGWNKGPDDSPFERAPLDLAARSRVVAAATPALHEAAMKVLHAG